MGEVAKIEPIAQEVDANLLEEEEDENEFAEITTINSTDEDEIDGTELAEIEADAEEFADNEVANIEPVTEDVVGNDLIEREAKAAEEDENEVAEVTIVSDTTNAKYDGAVDFDERQYADIEVISDEAAEEGAAPAK